MSALDDIIPADIRLSLYLAKRFLQELQLALQLIGVPSAYIRPGIEGVVFPRLYVGSTTYEPKALEVADDREEPVAEPPGKAEDATDEFDFFICAVPLPLPGQHHSRLVPALEWWFMWWSDLLMPICQATDMKYVARVIADQLGEESA
jgi:hypothetical protein